MKIIITTFLIVVSLAFTGPLWYAKYNGPSGGYASILDIVIDNDRNVYVTGIANSNNDDGDIITIKYNAQGDALWSRLTDCYYKDIAYSICIDEYGYSYVAGFTYDGTYYRLAVIKYNPDGTINCINADNVQNAFYMNSYTIKLDSQRNVYVATMYGTDAWLVTFDNNLNYRGSLLIDYGDLDCFNDMVITSDDKIIVTGRVETPLGSPEQTDKDMFIGKYIFNEGTGLFEEIWHYVSFPQAEYSIEKGHKVKLDNAGNVYVAGTTQTGSSQGYQHYCLWKFNADGNLQWMFNYNDPQGNSSSPCDLAVHPVTGISYMTGWRALNTNDVEIMTMAIDADMNLLWRDNWNYGSLYDEGHAIAISNYSVYVSGMVSSPGNNDMVTMCYRLSTGERKWIEIYRYSTSSKEIAWCNAVKQNGNYAYIVSAGQLQNPDYALTVMYKVLDNNSDNPAGHEEPMFYTQIYPQPCHDIMKITLSSPAEQWASVSLYDATGRKITDLYNDFAKTGLNKIVYNPDNLCNGVYFVRFDVGGITKTEKVVLQR
ncbi:MAG: T9SS type A sorting domain-containing protein [candidate division WOR-3 bacterium]